MALFFDVDGSVRSCCTVRHTIGWTTGPRRTSLPDMWKGYRVRQLREAVARGDLTEGCNECASVAAGPGRSASLAAGFDRWEASLGDAPIDLEFALSNTCNLQCVMCNGDLSSAIRSQREGREPAPKVYDEQFFKELDPWLFTAERVAFKGGEPFLAQESRRVMDRLIEIGSTAEVRVTTNGTVWSERVEEYVRRLNIGLIVSIDAMGRDLLERIRVGVVASDLWQNLDLMMAAAGGERITISYCLMPQNWQELAPLMAEADRRGLQVVVAYVNQPRTHTLLHLEPAELCQISKRMHEQGADLRPRDPELARVWEQALEWVRCCAEEPGFVGAGLQLLEPDVGLADGVSATPVAVPARPVAEVTVDPAAEVAALTAWSGADPVILTSRAGIITAVALPDWAQTWSGLGLEGRSSAELPEVLTAVIGRSIDPEVDDRSGGLVRVALKTGTETWGRAIVVPDGRDEQIYVFVSQEIRDW